MCYKDMDSEINKKFKILGIIFSRKCFMIALIFECLIKNISIISFGKFAIYFICVYALLTIIYRLIFERKMLFRKDLFIGYLFIISAIIPCIIYRFEGLYNDAVMIAIFAIMFLIVYNINNCEDAEHVRKEFVLINSIITFSYFLYTSISLIAALFIKSEVVQGLIEKSDFYAYNCMTVIGCSIYLYLTTDYPRLKFFHLINIVLHLVTIIFTQSRAVYLSVFISVIFILFYIFHYSINKITLKTTLAVFAITIPIVIVYFIIAKVDVYNIIAHMIEKGTSGREYIWTYGINVFIHTNMLFGLSYGALPYVWSKYMLEYPEYITIDIEKKNYNEIIGIIKRGFAHNIYFQQMFSHGIVGIVIMMYFIIRIFRGILVIIKDRNSNFPLFCSLVFVVIGQLIAGFFNNNLFFNIVYISQVMFFYYAGYISFVAYVK